MTASAPELLGMLVACGAAAGGVLARDSRLRFGSLAVALIAAPVLLLGDVWDQSRIEDLRGEPLLVAAALVLGVAAVIAGAAVFARLPWAFPVLAFALLALRVPVQLGDDSPHLLVPLYLVIAAAVLRYAYSAFREAAPGSARDVSEPGTDRGWLPGELRAAGWLRWALAGTLVLYALQSAYSEDVSNAIENATFFLVPFAALLVVLVEVRWTPRILGLVLGTVAAVGLGFAVVAAWQYAARDLFLNLDLEQSNQLHPYFRVNSLFFDPNVLGRYLALVITALAAYLAWARGATAWIVAAAALALLATLALTFSLTSFAALIAGLIVVSAIRWGALAGALAALATVAALGIFALSGGADPSDVGPKRDINAETSGRVDLVSGGIDLAADRPGWGWGSGSFGVAFVEHVKPAESVASHAEPVTVAAEQGILGVAVYVALLVSALAVMFAPGVRGSPARAAVAACFVAMIVHSLGYAGFIIDPATWALLALGIALTRTLPALPPAEV